VAKCPVWPSTFINVAHGHGCHEFAGDEVKNTLGYDRGKTFRRFVVPTTAITRVFLVTMEVVASSQNSADFHLP